MKAKYYLIAIFMVVFGWFAIKYFQNSSNRKIESLISNQKYNEALQYIQQSDLKDSVLLNYYSFSIHVNRKESSLNLGLKYLIRYFQKTNLDPNYIWKNNWNAFKSRLTINTENLAENLTEIGRAHV